MSLSTLVGNERIKTWLRRAAGAGRLPGTLILAGPEGVGKRAFALAVAKALNCLQPGPNFDSCDNCSVCMRIDTGQYSDVRVIEPDGQFIKVDQVREVVNENHYRPFEGRRRVYIFESAERLREQAANALLKTLEEPPPTSLLILVTASPDALLPTIRSRAMQLRFAPLPADLMADYLKKNYQRPVAEIKLLVQLAGGSIGRALSIDLSAYKEERKECLELLELLLKRRQRVRLLKAAEYFGRKERDDFARALRITLNLLRDIMCARLGVDEEIVNLDITKRIAELAEGLEFTYISWLTEKLTAIERNLSRNINRQLALEAVFLELTAQSAAR